jgi:hypothetical protein
MKKMILIKFLALALLQLPFEAKAQTKYDTTYVDLFPFKRSYALQKLNDNMSRGLPSNGLNLFSDKDSVFSLISGQVQQIVLIDSVYSVTIKSENEITVVYYNLCATPLAKGRQIIKGDFLGKAFYNDFTKDYYLSILINKARKPLSRQAHINMLCSIARCK